MADDDEEEPDDGAKGYIEGGWVGGYGPRGFCK